jgi:SMI1 / KNR4 family (SUKH-1)
VEVNESGVSEITLIEDWAGAKLPDAYKRILEGYEGRISNGPVFIYSAEDVIERNETFETREYCPGYITIGDDSGGRAIVIDLSDQRCRVFMVDHGSMNPEDFALVSTDLSAWVEAGCPLPTDEA